jgi:putative transposase
MPDHVHAMIWLPEPGELQRYMCGFHVYSQRKVEEKLQYMHENPVRAGLVEHAIDWRWSSARWYLCHRPVGVPLNWIEGA